MKIIKCLSQNIEKELDDAEEYIKMAMKEKEEYPEVANTYYKLSLNRMDGITQLHSQVVALINKYKTTEGQPPAPMMAIYDYMHERHIDKSVGIKKLQEMYKNGTV